MIFEGCVAILILFAEKFLIKKDSTRGASSVKNYNFD
jgi:hypothetical protein